VAVRILDKDLMATYSTHSMRMARGIQLQGRLKHPFVCNIQAIYDKRSSIYVVSERASTNLWSYLRINGPMPEPLAQQIFSQLVSAVAFCHAQGIFHRSIHLQNILLAEDLSVRLTSFEFADANDSDDLLALIQAAPHYAAPELFTKDPENSVFAKVDNSKLDSWSLGIVLCGILYAQLPFTHPTLHGLAHAVQTQSPDVPLQMPPMLRSLIYLMLAKDPRLRPTLAELQAHPWVLGASAVPPAPAAPLPFVDADQTVPEMA
jgi:serine/threonine protein kinase